ncbi:hypothetical protein GCM10010211_76410 [Streptomyces albospinus]|uniref:Uncharacterized protein n=1 Tax=Streptomyces albospinus TaxID=285515 RepID=A0ABQ2VQJ9_9ACTN|nr:hypothetical protein GCM10010211_76410 [Streptomyces albospinus]
MSRRPAQHDGPDLREVGAITMVAIATLEGRERRCGPPPVAPPARRKRKTPFVSRCCRESLRLVRRLPVLPSVAAYFSYEAGHGLLKMGFLDCSFERDGAR